MQNQSEQILANIDILILEPYLHPFFSSLMNETPLENLFQWDRNILQAMTSSVVTGIRGKQATGINGIQDI